MADKYGSYYNTGTYDVFRAAIRYEVTSSTNTAYTIRCRSWVQTGDGHDEGANFQGRAYITDEYSDWVAGSGYLDPGDESGWLGDITKVITRTHGDQTITCSGQGWARTWDAYTPWVNATVTVPKKPSYSVTYSANGGSGAPSSQTKWYGEDLTLRTGTPTRTGYAFKGWATTSGGSVAYAAGATYKGNKALALYAVWQANTYAVAYNANGGTGTTASQTKTYGVNLPLRANGFTRTNHVFDAWNTKADGTGTSYQEGATYTENKAATLYATWHAPYTVSYDANASSGTVSNLPASQVKVWDQALKLSSAAPSRSGHDFVGWATSPSGAKAYDPGGTVAASANQDLVLYALWKESAPTLSISGYYRSDDQGAPDDEGTHVTVAGAWSMAQQIGCTISADVYEASDTGHETSLGSDTDTSTGTSGTFMLTMSVTGGLDPDTQYDVVISATNTSVTPNATATRVARLGTSYYPIDVLNRSVGKGVAIGKPAKTPDLFDVGMPTSVDGDLSAQGVLSDGVVVASGGNLRLSGDSTYIYLRDDSHDNLFRIQKSNGQVYRHDGTSWDAVFWLSGYTRTANTVLAGPNGSNGEGSFRSLVAADLPPGTRAKGGTGVTARQSSTLTLSNCTASTNWCHHNGVVATLALGTMKLDAALSSGSTVSLGTIPSGYRPPANYVYAPVHCTNEDYSWGLFVAINSNGAVTLYNRCGKSLPTTASLYLTATYAI